MSRYEVVADVQFRNPGRTRLPEYDEMAALLRAGKTLRIPFTEDEAASRRLINAAISKHIKAMGQRGVPVRTTRTEGGFFMGATLPGAAGGETSIPAKASSPATGSVGAKLRSASTGQPGSSHSAARLATTHDDGGVVGNTHLRQEGLANASMVSGGTSPVKVSSKRQLAGSNPSPSSPIHICSGPARYLNSVGAGHLCEGGDE